MIFLYEHTLSYFKPKVWSNVGYVRICSRLLEPRVGRGARVKAASVLTVWISYFHLHLYIYLYVCVCSVCACVCVFIAALVHRCVPVHAHACAHTCGDLSLIPDGFLDCSLPWTHRGNIPPWPQSSSFTKPGHLTRSEDFLSMPPPQAGLTGNHYMWEPFLCKWSIAPSLEFIRDFIFYNHVNKSKWNGICCHQGSEIAKRLHSSGQLLSIGDLFLSVFWEWYPIHGDEQCDWLVMSVSGIEIEIHVWYINRGSTKLLTICIRSSIK